MSPGPMRAGPTCAINLHMDRDQAIARLATPAAKPKQLGIDHLFLFGSTTRGDARANSDVDLFFITRAAGSACSSGWR